MAEIEANGVRLHHELSGQGDDPTVYEIDLGALSDLSVPVLLSHGDQSPPMFTLVIDRLEAAVPGAERRLFEGAGHEITVTHPGDYAAAIIDFSDHL